MIVFEQADQADGGCSISLLFGTGLIGTGLGRRIGQRAGRIFFFPFRWGRSEQIRKDAAHVLAHLHQTLQAYPNIRASKIAVIWAAGRAGFVASEQETGEELASFGVVLDLAGRLHRDYPEIQLFFHLISSAGGLFEGQCLIHEGTVPRPRRCYGQLKLEQERRLSALPGGIVRHIYRLTSVYGITGADQRMGLIPTLIANGFRNKLSVIYGKPDTLREYVLNDDTSVFIEQKMFARSKQEETSFYLLGSGKPSSIYEVKKYVEQGINKKIYLQFYSPPELMNTSDITTSIRAFPAGWSATDLRTGIRRVTDCILSKNRSHPVPAAPACSGRRRLRKVQSDGVL